MSKKPTKALSIPYSEKLKDPRWQKKRLLILERDDFTCQCCGEDMEPLHVHHIDYRNGCDPWDYDNSELITFCEKCHEWEHKLIKIRNFFSTLAA